MNKKDENKSFNSLIRANKYIFKCNPVKYILLVLCNILKVVETIVLLEFAQFSTNAVYRLYTNTSNGIKYEGEVVIYFTIVILVLYFIGVETEILSKSITLEFSYNFERDLNIKLGNIKWDYYESHETNLKIHEVREKSLENIKELFNSSLFYINAVVSLCAYSFYLSQINLFVVAIYVFLILITRYMSKRLMKDIVSIWDKIQPLTQRQKYFFGISGDKTSHQEYRFNRLYNFVSKRWSKYFNDEYKLQLKIFRKIEITMQISRFIVNIPYIFMLIFVSYEIVIGKQEIGFLTLCFGMLNNIVNTLGSIQGMVNQNKIQSKFADSFFYVLNLEDESRNNKVYDDISELIKFTNISFGYPQSSRLALKGIDIDIKRGEKICVVGENGSGKTTFTSILMDLTDSYKGNILCEGEGTTNSSALDLNVSCILQDFAQYEMSVRENIEIGNVDYTFSEEEIMSLIEMVGLKECIDNLPDGIYTKLGSIYKGIELSKGQWQRLAIARLLANPKSTVWVLDEPTAYLDPLSEIEIYNLIYELAGNRTVFFISHRLGFAKRSDRIVVFHDGKIVEEGIHEELIRKEGIYYEMYKNQEAWYAA